jgi:hypothetical protein
MSRPSCRHYSIEVACMLALLCGATGARGQSPAERETLANPGHLVGDQYPNDLACGSSSLCIVLWDYGVFSSSNPPVFLVLRLGATTLAPAGGIVKEQIYAEDPQDDRGSVVPVGQQFSVFWKKTVPQGFLRPQKPVYQWLDQDLKPRSEVTFLPDHSGGLGGLKQAALIPCGFVQLWWVYDIFSPDTLSGGGLLVFTDGSGRELYPPVLVSADAAGEQQVGIGGLAVDLNAGIITAVYSQNFRDAEDPRDADVFFRRFSLAGEPLTPDVRMNTYLPLSQGSPAVASTPNGGFVAVWFSEEQDGSYLGIFGQLFNRAGAPLGPEFQVNQETFSDQLFAKVETDAAGDFAVVWQSYDPSAVGLNAWDIKARLFRADGRSVGPEIFVNQNRELEQESPLVAFAPNGTFVVAWHSNSNITGHDIFTRRFSASSGDEPCVVGGGKFWCDTGRTGGELEVKHDFGGGGSGWGFLGDIDGDGREDPCVYAGGTFRCDTDHEGGAAEVLIPFAIPGATVPLLGDVDGDGRADPCLAGGGAIYCDTKHDGGSAEVRIDFGQPGETLLLGDIDGDRKAEACAFAGGLFRCDTGHDGGRAEWTVSFGRRGDQPLLGDFDGDGRDDPCVFRKGLLLCDTAHDGGAAEGTLRLGGVKDRVALGNLDGL